MGLIYYPVGEERIRRQQYNSTEQSFMIVVKMFGKPNLQYPRDTIDKRFTDACQHIALYTFILATNTSVDTTNHINGH